MTPTERLILENQLVILEAIQSNTEIDNLEAVLGAIEKTKEAIFTPEIPEIPEYFNIKFVAKDIDGNIYGYSAMPTRGSDMIFMGSGLRDLNYYSRDFHFIGYGECFDLSTKKMVECPIVQ